MSTEIEHKTVTLSTVDIANPKFKTGLLFEIIKMQSVPWEFDHILTILSLNGAIYSLMEKSEVIDGKQNFHFELIDDIAPQVESIVERTLAEM